MNFCTHFIDNAWFSYKNSENNIKLIFYWYVANAFTNMHFLLICILFYLANREFRASSDISIVSCVSDAVSRFLVTQVTFIILLSGFMFYLKQKRTLYLQFIDKYVSFCIGSYLVYHVGFSCCLVRAVTKSDLSAFACVILPIEFAFTYHA